METIEKDFIDKSIWGPGPWQSEPDKVQWEDPETKLPCLAVRNKNLGHWCGYVGVAEKHPLYGRPYNDYELEIHGGLTFSGPCTEADPEHGICHMPSPGESDNVWWIGFDCAHGHDTMPNLKTPLFPEQEYRTIDYVKTECAGLAKQLKEMM